ncbi:nitrogen regulation protein NR(II) [Echinimonas agarilytica]|uniref:Sensory histidine kinase/phosphatase NtrB n=1 Tax=Echinimonas agarilytica TaxID=1215918 RepID=A0AA41WAR8_9GAMM|nr:nitrogen regulation protein NR(II) [Echinimonas agarilytica]MCM2681021.1 nitrogen regulation protein NR(II) [Echinimonas agarilytica]
MSSASAHLPITGISQPLLENLSTAVILIDQRLQIRYINAAGEQILSQSAQRLLGEKFTTLFEHCSLEPDLLLRLFSEGQGFSDGEVSLVPTEAEPLLADIAAAPMSVGGQSYALLELRRIDQQRRISQEIIQSAQQTAARDLVRSLAHEIKNPLGGLRGAAQLLQKELVDPNLGEFTQIIIEQADRLRNLVDRLLGPQQPGQRAEHNIHKVLETVRQLVSMEKSEDLAIVPDYDPSIPEFPMDPEQMQQAILNIVKNASEALSGKGRITFRTRIANRVTLKGVQYRLAVELSIIDNGPGIPIELQDTLFYPMVSGKPHGTGLGLSIAQTLAAQHSGRIDCSSWPGHTEFKMTLPIRKD